MRFKQLSVLAIFFFNVSAANAYKRRLPNQSKVELVSEKDASLNDKPYHLKQVHKEVDHDDSSHIQPHSTQVTSNPDLIASSQPSSVSANSTSSSHHKEKVSPTCFELGQFGKIGFEKNILKNHSHSSMCEDIHKDFGSCVNPESFKTTLIKMQEDMSSNFTDNLKSFGNLIPDIIQGAKKVLSELEMPKNNTDSEIKKAEMGAKLNETLLALGNETSLIAETKALSNDKTCLEVQKSLLLTTMCLISAKNISKPFVDFETGAITVTRPVSEVLVSSCDSTISLICRISNMIRALDPISDKELLKGHISKGCEQYKALKLCEKEKRKCPKYFDRVFENFFHPINPLTSTRIMEKDPTAQPFLHFKIAEKGLPVFEYLFEGAGILVSSLLGIAVFFV